MSTRRYIDEIIYRLGRCLFLDRHVLFLRCVMAPRQPPRCFLLDFLLSMTHTYRIYYCLAAQEGGREVSRDARAPFWGARRILNDEY